MREEGWKKRSGQECTTRRTQFYRKQRREPLKAVEGKGVVEEVQTTICETKENKMFQMMKMEGLKTQQTVKSQEEMKSATVWTVEQLRKKHKD